MNKFPVFDNLLIDLSPLKFVLGNSTGLQVTNFDNTHAHSRQLN